MKLPFPFAAVLASCLLGVVSAADLKVGDAAPRLQVARWVQGEPVKELEKGKVYVVEFWAAWCGPCVASIPHLNELHRALKDRGVVFIGQNVWEDDAAAPAAFVKKMGEKMTYRVALDDAKGGGKGFMSEKWLAAADQDGIPCAFVIDKQGTIAWIGHPSGLTEKMLVAVTEGKFDTRKAAEEAKQAEAEAEAMEAKFGELQEAVVARDWKKVTSLAGEMAKATHEPELLNELAWSLITQIDKPGQEVIDLAESITKKALELSKDEAEILDTFARIQFLQGKKEEAVKTEEKAAAKAEDAALKDELKKSLESYRKGELPPVEEEGE